MFQLKPASRTSALISAACLAGATGAAFAQDTPPPQPETPPAATQPSSQPATDQPATPAPIAPGDPRDTSAGGTELKPPPDRVGLITWGPINLISKPVDQAEDWLTKNARLDMGVRLAWFFRA